MTNHALALASSVPSVGMSAIQIANLVGYRVITTCSAELLGKCREYGAEIALDVSWHALLHPLAVRRR